MEWMVLPLKRYVDFGGRSRRLEFWMFFLFVVIVSLVASVVDHALGFGAVSTYVGPTGATTTVRSTGPIAKIVFLALLIPNIAVAIRRLHDTDRSGWWLLLSFVPVIGWIVLLVSYCLDGTPGSNRFDPDPKGGVAPSYH